MYDIYKYEKRGRNMEFSKYQFIEKLNTEFLEIEFGKLQQMNSF